MNEIGKEPLANREKFAVSLRKNKKKELLTKKRENLKSWNEATANDMNKFADLHPALSDPYATTEDKQQVVMELLNAEVNSSVNQNCTSPKLVKILTYVRRILGFSRQGFATPSLQMIENGLLTYLFKLLFTNKPTKLNLMIVGLSLQILAHLACDHARQCSEVFTQMKIKNYPSEFLSALVEFATANCAQENDMSDYTVSICRKIFRIIYNIVVKDSR